MAVAVPTADKSTRRARWRRLSRRLGLLFVRYHVKCAVAPESLVGPICYVLERDRLLDRLVLEDLCAARGWSGLGASSASQDVGRALWSLRVFKGWFVRRLLPNDDEPLRRLISHVEANPSDDIRLVPVAVFLGRAPAREHSWIKLLLAEDWAIGGRIRRFFAVLFHGRDVLVKISEPVSLRDLVAEDLGVQRTARKTARLLRVHFQRQRTASIGPDLSHRRLLLDEVLESATVREAIHREVMTTHRREARVTRRARRYAKEIAAHYSYPTVRVLDRIFSWLWNRLYDGVQVSHMETLEAVASGSEVVYVPCHRSHIDYLLLSYVIYRRGFPPPHIAAGINLNLPIVGPILRRGGAFFIRRTFRGDALYSAVVRSYFRVILAKGSPVKYFIEGTRSRTGRLLNPKLGLLSMTAQSFLLDRTRPLVFVPVYFGYEKLIEGEGFVGELRGDAKRKETLGGFLRSLRTLRERLGAVQVSFGEPIWLEDVLDRTHPPWRGADLEEPFRPAWVGDVVEELGTEIMTAINAAAVVNAVNLTALVVLSMPKQAIVEVELQAQLDLYKELLKRAPYAARTVVTEQQPAEMVRHCEEMAWLSRRPHPLGDVLRMEERRAILASYYRNNIVHLFALPSLVAASLNNSAEMTLTQLTEQLERFYPWLKADLFLRWDGQEVGREISAVVDAMESLQLLQSRHGLIARPAEGTRRSAQFQLCAEIVEPFLQRYYLSVVLLLEHGPGVLTRTEFLSRCSQAAEQLSLIYWLNSPDLFESGLFDNLVDSLLKEGILSEEAAGGLAFDDSLAGSAEALGLVLRPRVRQTLRHLAGAATTTPLTPPASTAR